MKDDELYSIEGSRLVLYPTIIENDIKSKLGYDISYMSSSNYNMNVVFYIFNDLTTEIALNLKKYFLYNIPLCIKVEIDKTDITIYITRNYFIDSLVCEMDLFNYPDNN